MKKEKSFKAIIIILIIVVSLWISGIIPRQIAKIYGNIYMSNHFPEMQLKYDSIEWSKYHDDYIITFKDKDNNTHGCTIGPKYFPINIGQGIYEIEEIYRKKIIEADVTEQVDFSETNNEKLKELNGCKYKHFEPSFNENGYGPDTYDFTQDMEYKDKFYHKIISNYDEYMIYKNRWNDICDMDEQDFENNFMIITAIENTSMLGLDIYEIHKDENILYIDFDVSKENYDNNETCNSIIIPNSLKCDIVEVRDLRKIK